MVPSVRGFETRYGTSSLQYPCQDKLIAWLHILIDSSGFLHQWRVGISGFVYSVGKVFDPLSGIVLEYMPDSTLIWVIVFLGLEQETLLNLLLRNYLHYNLYEAEKLRSKTVRSDSHSNQQVNSRRRSLHPCRSLYLCCVVQYFHSGLWLVAMSHLGGYLLWANQDNEFGISGLCSCAGICITWEEFEPFNWNTQMLRNVYCKLPARLPQVPEVFESNVPSGQLLSVFSWGRFQNTQLSCNRACAKLSFPTLSSPMFSLLLIEQVFPCFGKLLIVREGAHGRLWELEIWSSSMQLQIRMQMCSIQTKLTTWLYAYDIMSSGLAFATSASHIPVSHSGMWHWNCTWIQPLLLLMLRALGDLRIIEWSPFVCYLPFGNLSWDRASTCGSYSALCVLFCQLMNFENYDLLSDIYCLVPWRKLVEPKISMISAISCNLIISPICSVSLFK